MKDDLAKRLVQSLKDAGINFVTYLPETRLSQIIPIIRDDPDMELVLVASEVEAVTIAAGVSVGVMEGVVIPQKSCSRVSCARSFPGFTSSGLLTISVFALLG